MSRVCQKYALGAVFLASAIALAGCGGGSSSGASASASASASAGAFGKRGSAAPSAASSSASNPAGAHGRAPGASGPGVGPVGGRRSGGSINARVPATFQLAAGGRLVPSTVSVPAFVAIAVSVTSSDSARHTIVIRTPAPHTLGVGPDGHAAARIPGLRAGTYAITVDGASRGALIVGGEPGP